MALFVDETKGLRRYLNGQIVDINTNTQMFLNRLLQIQTTNSDYFTDENTWQTEANLNPDGCVYKFVLNYDEDGENIISVRLPKYPECIEIPLSQTVLKMYYFIQIAIGAETEDNIINEIELNNPYSLFDSKYSAHELNNISWLKSEGQWNAKSVYPTAYNELLKVYNGTETIEGLSVKLSTEDFTDYDFVINTDGETFRLALRNNTSDDDRSGLKLYYYIGESVQNPNLINAGRIGEVLPDKADIGYVISRTSRYIIDKSDSSIMPSYYIVYNDGWCEQGGFAKKNTTTTFLKPYINDKWVMSTCGVKTGDGNYDTGAIISKTASAFYNTATGSNATGCYWVAVGYIN